MNHLIYSNSWSLSLSEATKRDAVERDALRELRALEQLTLNHCQHTPRLLDAKVVQHSVRAEHPNTGRTSS